MRASAGLPPRSSKHGADASPATSSEFGSDRWCARNYSPRKSAFAGQWQVYESSAVGGNGLNEKLRLEDGMKMNSTVRAQYLAVSTAVLVALTVGCSRSSVQAAPAMPAPLVTVVKAKAKDVPQYFEEIGHN